MTMRLPRFLQSLARVPLGTAGQVLRMNAAAAAVELAAVGHSQSFRGLSLRSHPDAPSAASKVMLVHAEEVIFDDGTRVTTGLDRLVADITASGAGGLDTGAEAASRWYEVYAIRKSSDGTLTLLLHKAKRWAADQSFTTAPDATRALRRATSTATDKLAQGLTPTTTAAVPFVDVRLTRAGSVTGSIWFTIESDAAGSPSGSVLATSDKIDAAVVATSAQNLRVGFRTPATLTSGTLYHLVLQGDYTRSDTVNIAWSGLAAGGYTGGSAKEYTGASWGAASGVGDFYFLEYPETEGAAVTMPTGYDEKCLVGFVYNNASSNFETFIQHEKAVEYLGTSGTSNSLTSVTATVPLLVTLAEWLPPTAVRAHLMARSALATKSVFIAGLPEGYARTTVYTRLLYSATDSAMQHALPVITEWQAMYMWVDASTGTAWFLGYEW